MNYVIPLDISVEHKPLLSEQLHRTKFGKYQPNLDRTMNIGETQSLNFPTNISFFQKIELYEIASLIFFNTDLKNLHRQS